MLNIGVWFHASSTLLRYNKNTVTDMIVTEQGFPGGSDGKESACNAGDLGSISGLGRSPRVGSHKESDRTERLSRSLSILWHHNS